LIAQAAIALCVGALGVLLLLILGTQILDWQWPVGLFIIALGVGVYRVRRQHIPEYRTAQALDRKLGLEDRLSTAFYFRRLAPKTPELVEVVENQAIGRVHAGDVERAMPYSFPRSGYAASALVLSAVVLLGVRYGVLHTMDLERPLARINFDTFGEPKVEAKSNRKSVVQEHLEKQLAQLGMSLDELDQPQAEKDPQSPSPLDMQAVADEAGGNVEGKPGDSPNQSPEGSEQAKNGEQSSGAKSKDGSEQGAGEQSGEKGQKSAASQPKNGGKQGGNNPGVMDKMKDALANLLNKLGAKPPQQDGEQSASNESQQKGGQQQLSQKGMQGQGKSQGESQQSPDPQGGQQSESGQQTPGQQQRASNEDGNKPGSESSKSGMGKSDGDKDIKDAEQLAAMGKISEIFGKRAAEIQGEMSVEVPSGNQRLKTGYTSTSANHQGAVADANRNEIPLAYQPYVQRYFDEVRKSPAKTAPASKTTAR
jgi:hypothetical protein